MVKKPITHVELGNHTAAHIADRLAQKRAQPIMSAPVSQAAPSTSVPTRPTMIAPVFKPQKTEE